MDCTCKGCGSSKGAPDAHHKADREGADAAGNRARIIYTNLQFPQFLKRLIRPSCLGQFTKMSSRSFHRWHLTDPSMALITCTSQTDCSCILFHHSKVFSKKIGAVLCLMLMPSRCAKFGISEQSCIVPSASVVEYLVSCSMLVMFWKELQRLPSLICIRS